jgi:uncharacterized protein YeaO (DUF488 family)
MEKEKKEWGFTNEITTKNIKDVPLPQTKDEISKLITSIPPGKTITFYNKNDKSMGYFGLGVYSAGDDVYWILEKRVRGVGKDEHRFENIEELEKWAKRIKPNPNLVYTIDDASDYSHSSQKSDDITGQDSDGEFEPDKPRPQFEQLKKEIKKIIKESGFARENPELDWKNYKGDYKSFPPAPKGIKSMSDYDIWLKNQKPSKCPKCQFGEYSVLNPSNPGVHQCKKCQHKWNPDYEKNEGLGYSHGSVGRVPEKNP